MQSHYAQLDQESPALAGPVPPAEPLPFLKYIRAVRDNVVAGYHQELYRKSLVEIRRCRLNAFVVNEPSAIKHVLIDNAENYVKGLMEIRVLPAWPWRYTDEKDERNWRARRASMSAPIDHRSWLVNCPLILSAAQRLAEGWSCLPPGSVVDVAAEMSRLSLDIICRIVFSSDSAEFARIMEHASQRYQTETNLDLLDVVPLLDAPWKVYKRRRHKSIFKELDQALDRILVRRAASGSQERKDFLGQLLESRDPQTGAGLGTQEIKSQISTILGAGHETVGLTLMWIWYLLALHPQVESRLHAEIDQVLGGRQPAFEDLARLPYTHMVIEETLRLYPPFHTLAWRRALADDEICGVRIPRGSTVSIVPWVLHRHIDLWENPNRFDPERFLPERSRDRSRFAYLPFGLGPRVCVGASFAMTQIMLILVTLAQHYRIRLAPDQQIEVQALVSLKARYGIKVTIERRHQD